MDHELGQPRGGQVDVIERPTVLDHLAQEKQRLLLLLLLRIRIDYIIPRQIQILQLLVLTQHFDQADDLLRDQLVPTNVKICECLHLL